MYHHILNIYQTYTWYRCGYINDKGYSHICIIILNDIDTVYIIYHHLVSYLVEISTYIIRFNVFQRTEGQLCRLAQRWHRGKCLPWHGGTGFGSEASGEPQSDQPKTTCLGWGRSHGGNCISQAGHRGHRGISFFTQRYGNYAMEPPRNHWLIERAIPCEPHSISIRHPVTSRAWCFRTLPSPSWGRGFFLIGSVFVS